MKQDDVPQDAAILEQWHEITYAVDADGRYVLAPSAGWDAANLANLQAWQVIAEAIDAALQQVRSGAASPLAVHMACHQMDVALVAAYTGLARWRVRRHLKPRYYRKLSAELRSRYARAFRLSVDQLDRLPERVELPAAVGIAATELD